MRSRGFVMLLLTAIWVAGCGGASPTAPAAGAKVFSAQCSSCHSLSGRESPQRQGGDLLGYSMSRAQLLQFIHEMPTPTRLTHDQQREVADYVLALQRQHAARGA